MKKLIGTILMLITLGSLSARQRDPRATARSDASDRPAWDPMPLQMPSPRLAPPMAYWVNVLDYGAIGDGKTDDSAAILAAVNAAMVKAPSGGGIVYFPPAKSGGYLIGTTLTLPVPATWIELFFDGPLALNATLVVSGHYYLYGNSGVSLPSFSKGPVLGFGVGPQVSPAIHIQGNSVRLENIGVGYVSGEYGILVDGSSDVTFKNVWVTPHDYSTGTTPLLIVGGFGYYFEEGGYMAAPGSTNASVEFRYNPGCTTTGIVRMHRTYLSNHGVKLNWGAPALSQCGEGVSFTLEDILYEGAQDAFLTVWANSNVRGVRIQDISMSDSPLPQPPPMIDVLGTNAMGFQVFNATTAGSLYTTGDPIQGLEIWTPYNGLQLSQSSGYVLHQPSGIISTVPTTQKTGGTRPAVVWEPWNYHD